MKFETHITINTTTCVGAWKDRLKEIAKGSVGMWSTSEITDDPVLGPGNKFYFTSYNTDYLKALMNMDATVANLLYFGFVPIRKKIELIMFDERI
jgi:hypothetical protein